MTLKFQRNSHCSFCGTAFEAIPYPKVCKHCNNVTYINPLPVAVILLPIEKGLLTIRRNIEPKKGMLALPGGFIEVGESWQQAAARELFEEAGLSISHQDISLFDTLSAPDGTVLIFGLAKPHQSIHIQSFESNSETTELQIIESPQELAFPLHSQVVRKYFEGLKV